ACLPSPFTNPLVLLSDHCKLDVDSGAKCGDYGQRWHFNKTLGACSPFWYGGCDANANRFSTENECFETCGTSSKSPQPSTATTSTEHHVEVIDVELCYTSISFFSFFLGGGVRIDSRLSQPWYTFTSPSSSPDACFFKQDKGGCENYTLKWYFDTTQSECSRFWYGGCGGNGNRFETQEACEGLCLRRNSTHLKP
uniref:BPTI/Kunitz inhibitor domain-containing protein n=1 Tax=Salmo trutta TaxID=8032 RepID=A0A674AW12_SALTR